MTARCPSDLALEAYLLEVDRTPVDAHLDACEPCRARLARMREEGEEFRRLVFPATVEAVEDAAERPWKRWFNWRFVVAPVGALAAAAAAVLLIVRQPGPDYIGSKGAKLGLSVFVNAADGVRAIEDGAVVPASAALRFKVRPASDCWLWIMSVDASGQISRLYPPKGTPPDKRNEGPVPGGALLDGQAGPERIFAVCAPDEKMAWSEVKASAAVATGGAGRVRTAKSLGGPLARAVQATVLVEKRP